MRTALSLVLTFILGALTFAQSDEDLKNLFREHIELENAGTSVVMVEVSEKGSRFVSYGTTGGAKSPPAGPDTIFEIGSVTKVFTGILLAEAVRRGDVKLDDPISKFLPRDLKAPAFNGKEITLLDLATHTSGLPRLPGNFDPKDPLNPYADYTERGLYGFLSAYKLTVEPGTKYDYSNLAVGLLGHILSQKAKMPYQQLLKTRVLEPLGMKDTYFVVPGDAATRFASGMNEDSKPTPHWDFDVLAPAGGLRSTANDMAKFIGANLGITKTPIDDSLTAARKMYRQGQNERVKVGLNWMSVDLNGAETFWHGGGTYGFSSYIAIAPSKKKGYFLARNWGGSRGAQFLESVAFHGIDPNFPIRRPAAPKNETTLDAKTLEEYVGEYQVVPGFVLSITQKEAQLFAQATGQSRFELFAEKKDEFFAKITKLSITFIRSADGKVTSLVIHQGGADTPATRIK